MNIPEKSITFGIKEIIRAILAIIIALLIFFGGRYTASAAAEKRPTVLNVAKTSVTIGLDGSVNLFDYPSNTLTVIPDSMSQQVFLLYTSIIKNQGTQPQVPVKSRRVTNENKTE